MVGFALVSGLGQDPTVRGERRGKLKNIHPTNSKGVCGGKPINIDFKKRGHFPESANNLQNECYAPNLPENTKHYTQPPTTRRMVKIQSTENTQCW